VFILEGVKVLCFDAVSQVLILQGVEAEAKFENRNTELERAGESPHAAPPDAENNGKWSMTRVNE
jgi:hypothetical protein